MQRLRTTMVKIGASPVLRWRLFVAAAVLVVLQIASVSHLVAHSAAGDNSGCGICLTASGTGSAVPASAVVLPSVLAVASPAAVFVASLPLLVFCASYRARAPPVSR